MPDRGLPLAHRRERSLTSGRRGARHPKLAAPAGLGLERATCRDRSSRSCSTPPTASPSDPATDLVHAPLVKPATRKRMPIAITTSASSRRMIVSGILACIRAPT